MALDGTIERGMAHHGRGGRLSIGLCGGAVPLCGKLGEFKQRCRLFSNFSGSFAVGRGAGRGPSCQRNAICSLGWGSIQLHSTDYVDSLCQVLICEYVAVPSALQTWGARDVSLPRFAGERCLDCLGHWRIRSGFPPDWKVGKRRSCWQQPPHCRAWANLSHLRHSPGRALCS